MVMRAPQWLRAWHFLALGAGCFAYGALRGGGAARPQPPPPKPSGPAPEDYAPMVPEKTCDPTPKPGVTAFKDYVLTHFGGTNLGIIRECSAGLSGHTGGTAWDWGVLSGNARVSEMMSWLFANGDEVIRRAGIMYVIYNRHIWSTRSRGWQPYSGKSPHTDHVHFSFGPDGAMGRTSFFTPRNV